MMKAQSVETLVQAPEAIRKVSGNPSSPGEHLPLPPFPIREARPLTVSSTPRMRTIRPHPDAAHAQARRPIGRCRLQHVVSRARWSRGRHV
ncbi:hypothetical protein chiPu_0015741 [Chiloscyllium punctatum]|uniref:Uncharacterized protein n=1 Tax=Chiloscyllium punctatum TaxID=137246 RepID=A0A401T3K7_CHIPU|nr:hypothetical protein [Chiloscyllium punctatum]